LPTFEDVSLYGMPLQIILLQPNNVGNAAFMIVFEVAKKYIFPPFSKMNAVLHDTTSAQLKTLIK